MDHPFRGHGPLFLLLMAYLSGVFLGLACGPAWAAAASAGFLLSLILATFRRYPLATAMPVFFLCGSLAAGRLPLLDPSRVSPFLDNEVVLRAAVEEERPSRGGWSGVATDAVVSTLDGAGSVRLGRVLLFVRRSDAPAGLPSEVRAAGRLRPMRSYGNPGEVPREWSAMAMGVQYIFSADASKTVLLPQGKEGGGFQAAFRRARERTSRWMERHAGRSDGALYLRSLTTGEVPPAGHPMVALLRRTGLAHLLAISGVNVAVFFTVHAFLVRCVVWIFRRRHGCPDLNRLSAVLSLPVCWAYVFMAGAPVPAVRSAGMITLAVILFTVCRVRRADMAWTVLFFLTVAASPFQIFSPSFLLSYGASFFLISAFAVRSRESRALTAFGRLARWGREALIASAVAFLGTLPVSAFFFGGLPAGAILWNLVFGPVLGTAGVVGAFLAAVGGSFSIDVLGGAVRVAARGLTTALTLLSGLSGGGWGYLSLPPSGVAPLLLCTGAAVWGTLRLRRAGKAPWPAALCGAVAFLAWIHLPYAALPDRCLTLTALNVGKGAAHVVSFPGGGHMVIDGGSAVHGDAGRRLVAPFLRSRGIRRIDVLVLTHPHEDHYGGAQALLEEFPVGEVWIPEGVPLESFGEAVIRRTPLVRRKSTGDVFSAGGAEVIVRGTGESGTARGANERSLLLEIRHRTLGVWLPGDVETGPDAWGDTERKGEEKRVLFLPHHGSPGADPRAWWEAARPEAVVSQNRNCLHGKNLLPSFEYFLLENGAFTVRSDGKALMIEQEGVSRAWSLMWRLP